MLSYGSDEARISAPKITDLTWQGDSYDPRRHQFTHICRRLRLLQILLEPSVTPLMEVFDEVDILSLGIYIHGGIAGYESFLNETSKLSTCETLRISLAWNQHGTAPAILHLLRCCNGIKKLSTKLIQKNSPTLTYSCPSACPCRFVESCKVDDIALRSLEEVEIDSFKVSHKEMEFVELLSRCNAEVLRKLTVNCTTTADPASPALTKEVCEKVRHICRPDLQVEFYVTSDQKRVRFD